MQAAGWLTDLALRVIVECVPFSFRRCDFFITGRGQIRIFSTPHLATWVAGGGERCARTHLAVSYGRTGQNGEEIGPFQAPCPFLSPLQTSCPRAGIPKMWVICQGSRFLCLWAARLLFNPLGMSSVLREEVSKRSTAGILDPSRQIRALRLRSKSSEHKRRCVP